MNHKRSILAALGAGVLLSSVAACGGDDGSSGSGGGEGSYIVGTTESITAMDPAGSYDMGSSTMQYSLYQQLVTIPAGGDQPVGDAAESCEYSDPKTLTCKLRKGLKFSNGNELTSSDVKFSMERNIAIASPNGASGLLANISNGDTKKPALADGAIETPDDQTVVFHLNSPDQTFVKVLTYAATSIVDEETYPANKLLEDDKVVGSGPYQLGQFEKDQQVVFESNPEYTGDRKPESDQVFVQFFADPAPLKQAVETGQVDIAWRTLSPTDLADLEKNDEVTVHEGDGSEFRYWVWQFANPVAKDKAVRQAVAQIIDRDAIAKNAYDGTVDPSYSIVPPGFPGQKDSFEEKYGEPSVDKAKALLQKAGVKTPVNLKLGYTPTHYGPNAVDEANELAEQLNGSGLFKVTTDDAEWEEYQTLYKQGAYDLFILGWYPDFLDADNYLSPFLRDGGFYENNYSSAQVNKLLSAELAETDEKKREQTFGQLQDITAEDVPLVPSWIGKNVAVSHGKVNGLDETLDPTYVFRLWSISKG